MKELFSGTTVLIKNLSFEDLIFVKAASKLGIKMVGTTKLDPPSEREKIAEFFPDIPLERMPSAFDRNISPARAHLLDLDIYKKIEKKFKTSLHLRTPRYTESSYWPLKFTSLLPLLRKHFSLLGLHWDKALYLEKLARAGVAVPEIYQIVPDEAFTWDPGKKIMFPCICKPAYCSGGFGVMVAHDKEDLDFLFEPELYPENFTEYNLHYRNRNGRGLRNYVYNSGPLGGPYLIQQFVPGRLLSVSGTVVQGKAASIFCYEIGSTPNKYCAEQSFQWPLGSQLEERLAELSERLVTVLGYPHGPFMFDAILSEDDELMVIDAAPRASITGAQLSEWVYRNDRHALAIVASHWNQQLDFPPSDRRGRPIFWQRFPFPKGKLNEITYPDLNQDFIVYAETPLRSGDQIFEPRLDRQMAQRGCLVTTGPSLEAAKNNWDEVFKQIRWSMQ